MKSLFHFFLRKVLKLLPHRLLRVLFVFTRDEMSDDFLFSRGILTMFGSLSAAARNGLAPGTVIDIGAYVGDWTRRARPIFPNARFLLIEANPQKQEALERLKREVPGLDYVVSLLGSDPKDAVPYYLFETGSSVLEEVTNYEKEIVHLPMETVDRVVERFSLPTPYFIKLDVQGFELEVLKGATQTLTQTEAVLAEVALLEYNKNAPLLAEVVAFFHDRGFELFDVLSQARRFSDQALFQVDLLFVRSDHPLRARRSFYQDEPEKTNYE